MLGSGVTFSATLVRTLEFLVQTFSTSPPLLGVANTAIVLVAALFVVVGIVDLAGASASTRLVLTGRG